MRKKQENYQFDTSKVSVNQRFSSFKALFAAVTGREPPTGQANLRIAKGNLKRHLNYDIAIKLDSNEKSKRAIIITEIYNSPVIVSENRGKHGKYVDNMKPLLLRKQEFQGKEYILWNELGLFSKYFKKTTASPEIQKLIEKRASEFDYDLWKPSKKITLGEGTYRAILRNKLKEITESALNSLQKDGIIEWEKHYVWIPNIHTLTVDYKPRIAAFKELQEESKNHAKALCEAASEVNSVLKSDVISALFIGASEKDKPQYEELKKRVEIDRNLNPISATAEQAAAIENYQLYIRQCAYSEYQAKEHGQKEENFPLLKREYIPNKGKVFSIPELKRIYDKTDKSCRKKLLGDIQFWQEIQYQIIDKTKLKRQTLQEKLNLSTILAENISLCVLAYMDEQMKKHECKVTKDVNPADIGGWGIILEGTAFLLGDFLDAARLHKELKQQYGRLVEPSKENCCGGKQDDLSDVPLKDFAF